MLETLTMRPLAFRNKGNKALVSRIWPNTFMSIAFCKWPRGAHSMKPVGAKPALFTRAARGNPRFLQTFATSSANFFTTSSLVTSNVDPTIPLLLLPKAFLPSSVRHPATTT